MAFLDPKENFLDIILTQHGRKLLSQGKLNIKYYSFGDTEVDYSPSFIKDEFESLKVVGNSILTEDGDELTTEDGDFIVTE